MKFSHIADAHLGAFSKSKTLRELNLKAFEEAIEKSISEGVDFIIIAGDLYHNPLPDMDIVKRSVEIMKRAKEEGIRIYVVYGSHDFSAGTTSLLDVLAETGLFQKVVRYEMHDGKIRLLPTEDETGVRLVGMPGMTSAMEVRYFTEDALDMEFLEEIPNPKIFIFHTTIYELKPDYLADKNAVPISKFPKGFDYYAGGHLHERIEYDFNGSPLRYTGALFGATYNDLDVIGEKEKGFYIVEDFKPRFIPIKVCEFEKKIYDATGKSASRVEEELLEYGKKDHGNRVVILKVRGELSSGKIADINFRKIREEMEKTALDVLLNTYALTTKERKSISVPGETQEDIENRVFEEISDFGVDFTKSLFHVLKSEKMEGENKRDFAERIWSTAKPLIDEALKKKIEKNKPKPEGKEKKPVSLFDFG